MAIIKTNLHPENNKEDILYPKTSADQIVNLSTFILENQQKISKIVVTGTEVTDNETVTHLSVEMNDGTTKTFNVIAKNGADGADGADGAKGNGIVFINSGTPYISGNDTITPITIETDEHTENITISARNGTDGRDGIFQFDGQFIQQSDGNNKILVFNTSNYARTLKIGDYVMITSAVLITDLKVRGFAYPFNPEDRADIEIPVGGKEIPITDFYVGGKINLNGEDGASVNLITALGYRAGTGSNVGYTETMLKAHMTDNTDKEFSVFAKDGEAGILKEFGFVELNWTGISEVHYIDKNGITRTASNGDIFKPACNTPIRIKVGSDVSLTTLNFLNGEEQPYSEGVEVIYLNNNGTIKTLTLIPDMTSRLSITSGNIYLIVTPRTNTNALGYLKITA